MLPRSHLGLRCRTVRPGEAVRCAARRRQLYVCQNKTCKSQGSGEILKFVQDLDVKEVEGIGCGCLGQCGSGPNVLVLPDEIHVNHVGTAAKMQELLTTQCNVPITTDLVSATQLRLAGNAAARSGHFEAAEAKYTEALELNVAEQCHLLYANRSGVRLRAGNVEGAMSDALAAIDCAPGSYTTGYMRLIDVHYLQKNYRSASAVLEALVQRSPQFKETSDYLVIAKQLQEDLKSSTRC